MSTGETKVKVLEKKSVAILIMSLMIIVALLAVKTSILKTIVNGKIKCTKIRH